METNLLLPFNLIFLILLDLIVIKVRLLRQRIIMDRSLSCFEVSNPF